MILLGTLAFVAIAFYLGRTYFELLFLMDVEVELQFTIKTIFWAVFEGTFFSVCLLVLNRTIDSLEANLLLHKKYLKFRWTFRAFLISRIISYFLLILATELDTRHSNICHYVMKDKIMALEWAMTSIDGTFLIIFYIIWRPESS